MIPEYKKSRTVKAIRFFLIVECQSFSALEAGVRLPVVEQVADAVHSVLEERRGCEYEHTDRWIDGRVGSQSGNEPGVSPAEAEISEHIQGGGVGGGNVRADSCYNGR